MFVYACPMSDHDLPQRAVLDALLEAHPRLLEADELTAQLSDVPRVNQVLRVLVEDGLATRLGDPVGASHAAVRFDALRQ
jgi:Fe2+ or Zn2+ uptake regulation protein